MSTLNERLAASTDPRDADALRWNEALASGDKQVIEATAEALLVDAYTSMMNDDPNYVVGGWTPK